MTSKSVAVIAGVGPGTGASIAKKFAKVYNVALLARNPDNYSSLVDEINRQGGEAVGISTDISSALSVRHAFEKIASEFGGASLAAAVYNVGGSFIRKPFLDLSEEDYMAGFSANGQGAFLFSQAVIPLLLKSVKAHMDHPPTLIFTGATASVKGSAYCASFSSGKFALRALSQSLAREFGPQGVHISHVIIDGVIDVDRTKHYAISAPDGKIDTGSIADQYWNLHVQPRTAFTYELDIRPYIEKW